MISRDVVENMVHLARQYDRYTKYIEDYSQMQRAEAKNKELKKEWNAILTEYNLNMLGISSYANLGDETEYEITEKLKNLGEY